MTPKLNEVISATPEQFDAEVRKLELWMKAARTGTTDRHNIMAMMERLRSRLFGARETEQ